MARFVKFGLLPALFGRALAQTYAAPGECSGACNIHDPSVIQRDDGVYFMFSTGNLISYSSAPSIEGPWTAIGSVVPGGSSIDLPGNDDLWAPEVRKVGDQYYVYYSVSQFESQNSAIGLATSETMDLDSWIDQGSIGISSDGSQPYNAIDADLTNVDGTYYLTWGSFWENIFQVEMNDDATSAVGPEYNIAYQPEGDHRVEGPTVYQHGEFYYLFFSAGLCCQYDADMPPPGEEYRIMACRSSTATGGFVDEAGVDCTEGGGTVVLESHSNVYGPGGQGVFTDPDLGPVLYYHYVDTNIGYADGQKLFGWNQIDFSTGWPVV